LIFSTTFVWNIFHSKTNWARCDKNVYWFFTVSPCISIHYIYSGPTNALVCNKTLIQISHSKTLKITPTCFDHQMIIVRELFDPG
jgi:hypothetical protein